MIFCRLVCYLLFLVAKTIQSRPVAGFEGSLKSRAFSARLRFEIFDWSANGNSLVFVV